MFPISRASRAPYDAPGLLCQKIGRKEMKKKFVSCNYDDTDNMLTTKVQTVTKVLNLSMQKLPGPALSLGEPRCYALIEQPFVHENLKT